MGTKKPTSDIFGAQSSSEFEILTYTHTRFCKKAAKTIQYTKSWLTILNKS